MKNRICAFTATSLYEKRFGFYLQDNWKVNSRFSPRAGFAYRKNMVFRVTYNGKHGVNSEGIVSLSNSYNPSDQNGFKPRQLQGTLRLEW